MPPARILIAPASYKTTVSSLQATRILERVLARELPGCWIETKVMTDGGEGTIDAFVYNFGGTVRAYEVTGPLGDPVVAKVCWLDPTSAVLESAQAVGYSLLSPSSMDPWRSTSAGVGELLLRLVAEGARSIIVTMGDSVTMDMGIGMLDALGIRFFAGTGRVERPQLGDLVRLTRFDATALNRLAGVTVMAFGDTKDYLCGQRGQAAVYGRQKGMRPSDAQAVESAFLAFSRLITRQIGVDVLPLPMATGSGGLAAALHAFLTAPLLHTPEYFASRIGLLDAARAADVLITGEGCLDDQTRWGKIPHFVASRCGGLCVNIVGSYTEEGKRDLELATAGSVAFVPLPSSYALDVPEEALAEAGRAVARLLAGWD